MQTFAHTCTHTAHAHVDTRKPTHPPPTPPPHPPSFANKYRGFYQDKCDPDAADFYASKSYYDDLAWAALWLKRATGEKWYLDQAKQ